MFRVPLPLLLAVSTVLAALAHAVQGGDQWLGGIGETGPVARYVLDGTAEDSSRNQLHATQRGGTFVDDAQFRRAGAAWPDGI